MTEVDRAGTIQGSVPLHDEAVLPPGAGIGFALVVSLGFWGLVAAFFF